MAQIECKDVSVKYESQEVLKDISFSIEAGDYLCIVGENGSGKSTLVKTILGLENAKTGEVIFGDNLNKNEIGYLPQQTQAQKDFPASNRCILFTKSSTATVSPAPRSSLRAHPENQWPIRSWSLL